MRWKGARLKVWGFTPVSLCSSCLQRIKYVREKSIEFHIQFGCFVIQQTRVRLKNIFIFYFHFCYLFIPLHRAMRQHFMGLWWWLSYEIFFKLRKKNFYFLKMLFFFKSTLNVIRPLSPLHYIDYPVQLRLFFIDFKHFSLRLFPTLVHHTSFVP